MGLPEYANFTSTAKDCLPDFEDGFIPKTITFISTEFPEARAALLLLYMKPFREFLDT
jgi:hypothetical protein